MIRCFLCWLIFAGLVSTNLVVYGEGEKPSLNKPDHILVQSDQLTWKEGPASLPRGTKVAVLEGNPSAPEAFTMRLDVPANYTVPRTGIRPLNM